jgi:hypothetical protein
VYSAPPTRPPPAGPQDAGIPPPVSAAPERDESGAADEEKAEDGEDVFRIGFLVGTGLPSVIGFGLAMKITSFFGAGVNIGLIPAVTVPLYGEAELSYQVYDVYGRLFPFGGAFFLGAGVGFANIHGTFTNRYDVTALQGQVPGLPNPLVVTSEGSVRTMVLTPSVGLQHTFASGFTLGVDAGAQIPIAPSDTTFETAVPPSVPPALVSRYVTPNDETVRESLDTMGRQVLPTLNIRIGWLF